MIKSTFGVGKNREDAKACVMEAVKDFKDPKMIIFFSGEKHFCEYSKILHELYPKAVCMGSSTYRTWNNHETAKDQLDVVAIEDGITCSARVIEKADSFALSYADQVKSCLDEIGENENTLCLEFTVPYKRCEEFALMALNSILLRNEIPIIGGTASNIGADRDESDEAYVSLNGEIYPEGCVFALIHNLGGRIVLKRENIYEPLTGKEFLVTKANNQTRTIMTYDNLPATEAYASELNVPVEDISKYFFSHPMGRCVGPRTLIAAIHGESSKGSLKFHSRVHEGTKMMVMKEGNFKEITRKTIEEIKEKVEKPSLVLMFHCVARTVLFERNGYIDEYQKLLAEAFPNFIGYACLGEQQWTKNFNQTMMLAVFE